MGCGGSKPGRQTRQGDQGVHLVNLSSTATGAQSHGNSSTSRPLRTTRGMTPAIRHECLAAVHRAFGSLDYGVIGGTALAEYGNNRATSDIDVMVPRGISEVVDPHLLRNGMVRTQGGGLGYIASDGNCYGLDITTDIGIGQTFKGRAETVEVQTSPARLMRLTFLLDSKAYSYMTRIGLDADNKKVQDARDIIFILDYLHRSKTQVDSRKCKWVTDYDFWTTFTRNFEGTEKRLGSAGLRRDTTPNESNRSTRRASSASRASSGSGSRR